MWHDQKNRLYVLGICAVTAALAERWLKEVKDDAADDFLKVTCGEWFSIHNRTRGHVGGD